MAIGKGSLQRAASAAKTVQHVNDELQKMKENPEEKAEADKASGKRVSKTKSQKNAQSASEAEKREMWTAQVKSSQLCEIPDEWREPKYVKPNVSMLAESVSRCGILEPLPVVQIGEETYQLVGGSRRMEVVKMLGMESVPVIVLPGTTLEDAKKLYDEMRPFTDAAQDTIHNAKFRTASLFGAQRIPNYLL